MRLSNLGKGNPQKKLISFRFLDLVNGLLKAEAGSKETTESALVEKKILDTYLNKDDRLAAIVSDNILRENGIVQCAMRIFNLYRENPSYVNDTLLDVIRFLQKMSNRYEPRLKTTDDGTDDLSRYAAEYERYIKEWVEKDAGVTYYDTDGESIKYVDPIGLHALHDVTEANSSQHRLDTENLVYVCFTNVLSFWNFGGDLNAPGLKHWNITYAMMKAAISLCRFPDYEPFIYEFSQLVKKITMAESKAGTFDGSVSLTRNVFIRHKSFATTEDAVIIKTVDNEQDGNFKNAYRVIHGPGMPPTKRPYILLCNDENEQELHAVLKKKLVHYAEEFPNVDDAYAVQFLFEGAYFDKRVRWRTI